MKQGKKDGVPVILESMAHRKVWYERNGFREVGEKVEVDAGGQKDGLCHMRADP